MKEELRFNWLDVFRAPRIALSLQKIWVMFPPLLLGYLFYLAFTFLGLWVSGEAVLKSAWRSSGLLPCAVGTGATGWGFLLWIVGLVGLVIAFLFGGTAVARATFLELKGETFFTYRELYAFAGKHAKSAVMGPLGIFGVVVGIVLCGLVLGLVGRIPYAGPIPVVAFSPVWFGICFFLTVLVIVLGFCVLLAPAITATSKGDFFEVITETFSVSFSEPYRLVWYQAVLFTVTGVAVSVFWLVVKLAYKFMIIILSFGMGETFEHIAGKANWVLLRAFAPLMGSDLGFGVAVRAGYFNLGVGTSPLPFGQAFPVSTAATGYEAFWAYVLAIVVAFAGFLVIACYGAAVLAAGNTVSYVVLHKIKDEENLLEIEEEEEEEEEEETGEKKEEEKAASEETKEEKPEKAEIEKPIEGAQEETAEKAEEKPEEAGRPPEDRESGPEEKPGGEEGASEEGASEEEKTEEPSGEASSEAEKEETSEEKPAKKKTRKKRSKKPKKSEDSGD